MNSATLGSDYAYTTYSLDADAYFSAPPAHHVVAPTLYGFYSQGQQLTQSNFTWDYLPIRGYPSTNMRGNKGVLLATEYRLPLWYTEKAVMYGYAFLDRVWAALFYDVGGAILGPVSNLSLKRSYGAELNFRTMFFWYLAFDIKLGYAKGLDSGGEEKYYFSIGM
jgi:hemolysin activation/secretion protein